MFSNKSRTVSLIRLSLSCQSSAPPHRDPSEIGRSVKFRLGNLGNGFSFEKEIFIH